MGSGYKGFADLGLLGVLGDKTLGVLGILGDLGDGGLGTRECGLEAGLGAGSSFGILLNRVFFLGKGAYVSLMSAVLGLLPGDSGWASASLLGGSVAFFPANSWFCFVIFGFFADFGIGDSDSDSDSDFRFLVLDVLDVTGLLLGAFGFVVCVVLELFLIDVPTSSFLDFGFSTRHPIGASSELDSLTGFCSTFFLASFLIGDILTGDSNSESLTYFFNGFLTGFLVVSFTGVSIDSDDPSYAIPNSSLDSTT